MIAELLRSVPATQLTAFVRKADTVQDLAQLGVTVREGDYNRPGTLDAAFAGADKLLLISSSEVGKRVAQHRNVIEAANLAGISLIAYTSILHADTNPIELAAEHRETEALLREAGVPFVLLRNGWYSENYTSSAPAAVQHGAVLGSAKDGRIASAARADYAAAAAAVLTSDEDQAGKTYELAGDEAYTLLQLAAEIAGQSRKPVIYKDLPEQDYKAVLIGMGLPAPLAGLIAESDVKASQGALFDESHQMSALIGRPTTPLARSVSDALH